MAFGIIRLIAREWQLGSNIEKQPLENFEALQAGMFIALEMIRDLGTGGYEEDKKIGRLNCSRGLSPVCCVRMGTDNTVRS